jgi:hypothetical protein
VIVRLTYPCEPPEETAVFSLAGTLRDGEDAMLHRLVAALPAHIRAIRLELHALGRVDQKTTIETLRPLLRRWRASHGHAFRLSVSTAHGVVAYTEPNRAARMPSPLDAG